jgi:hypothetical protein
MKTFVNFHKKSAKVSPFFQQKAPETTCMAVFSRTPHGRQGYGLNLSEIPTG